MKRYKNKYRIESVRLKSWDYKNPWWYYVTMCTKNHKEWFGEIINSKMQLNKLGKVTDENWLAITSHYPEVELDYYIIMPNHIHGIVILGDISKETGHAPSLRHSLSNVIGSYKSGVTKWAHQNGYKNFRWQIRFYDRIIRNEKELFRIRKYIQLNPLKWEIEKDIPENMDID